MDCREGPSTNRQPLIGGLGFVGNASRMTPPSTLGNVLRIDSAHVESEFVEDQFDVHDQLRSLLISLHERQDELQRQSESLTRTRHELEQARAQYLELYESASVGFCSISDTGIILHANATLTSLLGMTGKSLNGQFLRDFVCGSFKAMFDQRQQQLVETREPLTFELKLLRSNAAPFWGQASASVSIGRHEELIFRIVITDITSLKETQTALAESDRHLMLIAGNMPGPVSRVNRDLRYLFVNPFYEKITGRKPETLVGLSMREVLGPNLFKTIEPHIEQVLAGKLVTFSNQIELPDGVTQFGLTTYIPELSDTKEVIGFFVVGLDITTSKLTEQALATTTDLLELTGQLACVGGWELDLRTQELIWTQETFRIHELDTLITPSLEEAFGYFETEHQAKLRATVEQAIKCGTNWDLELPLVTAKGNHIWVRTQGVVVYENGQAIKLQGALHDVTERRQADAARVQLESQLRESQKMEAIGTLAGGVAHDFNNILAAIMSNADLAIQSLESPLVTLCCLQEITKASERARDLVRQILSFSRPHATERKLISLVDVVEESIRLLRATLPARVALTLECTGQVPQILADTTQIEQVILNLATNSYQAFRGSPGCITIDVDTVPHSAELAEAVPHLKSSLGRTEQFVRLTVADDGPGMDASVVARLFEPFFTTKPVGEGTGLGLAVVHGIIRTHEGAITVESKPGEGAAFTVYLPVPTIEDNAAATCASKAEELERIASPPPTNEHQLRILYVDDDQAVMQSICKLLELRGFTVEGFCNQMEAVEAIRTRADQFDLVVSDYNMPSLSGIDFARFVRQTRPELPVVIISGLIDDELRTEALNAGVSDLISKPFSLKAFCTVVQRFSTANA